MGPREWCCTFESKCTLRLKQHLCLKSPQFIVHDEKLSDFAKQGHDGTLKKRFDMRKGVTAKLSFTNAPGVTLFFCLITAFLMHQAAIKK